jgi:hypothetical protein
MQGLFFIELLGIYFTILQAYEYVEASYCRFKMSTRNLLGGKGRLALKAENRTAIWEPMSRRYGNLDVSETYGPPWPVTRIVLLFIYAIISLLMTPKKLMPCVTMFRHRYQHDHLPILILLYYREHAEIAVGC